MIEYEIVCAAGGCEIAISADADFCDYYELYREGSCADRVMEEIADKAFEYFCDNPFMKVTTIVDSEECEWTCVKTLFHFSD